MESSFILVARVMYVAVVRSNGVMWRSDSRSETGSDGMWPLFYEVISASQFVLQSNSYCWMLNFFGCTVELFQSG
jgi:hypothetical protein